MDAAEKTKKTEAEWRRILPPERFAIMRKGKTERPFTGKYDDFWEKGTYVCAGCGRPLFGSAVKYDSGTGWPSFSAAVDDRTLETRDDYSLLTKRIEVRCAGCGAHLGHVFDDGPPPTFLHYCINSASLDFVPAAGDAPGAEAKGGTAGGGGESQAPAPDKRGEDKDPAGLETATFAAGCFWGVEDKLAHVPGVVATEVGYTGGKTPHPSYEDVCTGKTGHAEAVRVTFDPAKVGYEELVRRFFEIHDPTQVGRQGPDVGSQYRSAIFYHSEAQRAAARRVMDEITASGKLKRPLATELVPASTFNRAEEYHQKYCERHGISCG